MDTVWVSLTKAQEGEDLFEEMRPSVAKASTPLKGHSDLLAEQDGHCMSVNASKATAVTHIMHTQYLNHSYFWLNSF